jgi:hypothetical protein
MSIQSKRWFIDLCALNDFAIADGEEGVKLGYKLSFCYIIDICCAGFIC